MTTDKSVISFDLRRLGRGWDVQIHQTPVSEEPEISCSPLYDAFEEPKAL